MSGAAAYEQLSDLYDIWCAEVAEDLPFYLQLASAVAADRGVDSLEIIELGAGSGRVTLPLAQAGHHVTAIDLATTQLATLRERTAACSPRPTVVEGDMRDLARLVPAASADLVLVPFRGLLHVTDDRDAVLSAIADALRPGGVVAFDVFHPQPGQVSATDARWLHRRNEPTQTGRWRFDERARYTPTSDGFALDVDVRCTWSPMRRLRRPRSDASLPDPGVGAAHERRALLQLRTVPHAEWGASLHAAGLELDGAYGWFDGRPLGPDDDDSIWVARRE